MDNVVRRAREAYVVQYSIPELDARGKRKRVIKTFDRKKEADAFHAQVRVDLGKGTHVPASKSPTLVEAGRNWIDACADLERTTRTGTNSTSATRLPLVLAD